MHIKSMDERMQVHGSAGSRFLLRKKSDMTLLRNVTKSDQSSRVPIKTLKKLLGMQNPPK